MSGNVDVCMTICVELLCHVSTEAVYCGNKLLRRNGTPENRTAYADKLDYLLAGINSMNCISSCDNSNKCTLDNHIQMID